MAVQSLLNNAKKNGEKKFAILIDPDEIRLDNLDQILKVSESSSADFFFIGGSLIMDDQMDLCLDKLKSHSKVPVVIFPGSTFQINKKADALFFLSLISGRNADFLIGNQFVAAPYLIKSGLEIMPTGYMLIDGGVKTTVEYVSNTHPIPANKPDIALCTAMTGEMLGLRNIYMDAGSGAQNPISNEMVKRVSKGISVPLMVGGGIRTPEKAGAVADAGATVVVVGNAIEKDPNLVVEIADAVHQYSKPIL